MIQTWLARSGVGSLLVGLGTWLATAGADGEITLAEAGGLLVVLGGAATIKGVRDRNKPEPG